MKADKLKSTQQMEYALGLIEKGLSRKEVVEKVSKKFKLTRRTATTYVYLWFRGDQYKISKDSDADAKNVTK